MLDARGAELRVTDRKKGGGDCGKYEDANSVNVCKKIAMFDWKIIINFEDQVTAADTNAKVTGRVQAKVRQLGDKGCEN